MDDDHDGAHVINVVAKEIIDEDNIDDDADLSLSNWISTPSRHALQDGRDLPSSFNLATMQSSRD